ncbi:MAG: T9SS type A sorting domain-containing protein [Planctomycetia bacterium]|nr:T9SS type A sorting domain-containing protein [Planctomycetia bacterium]
MKKSIIILCLFVTLYADTDVGGIINSNQTWILANSPYIVVNDIIVYGGVTLIIEPGVVVKFNSHTELRIGGTLISKGKIDSIITFTNNESSSNWDGIAFIDSSIPATIDSNFTYIGGSIIQYTEIRYACGDRGFRTGPISCYGASPFIADNIITNNKNDGWKGAITISSAGTQSPTEPIILRNNINNNSSNAIALERATAIIRYNNISSNGGYGVMIDHYATPNVENNIFYNNQGGIYFNYYTKSNSTFPIYNNSFSNIEYEFYLENNISESGWVLEIGSNWFNTTDSIYISQKVYDYFNLISEAKLDYVPFLTEPDQYTPTLNIKSEKSIPNNFQLMQNYPNPFNPITQISYELPQDSKVELTIYNTLGEQVVKLVDENQAIGRYSINWNGQNSFGEQVPGGIYFYTLRTKDFTKTRKMLLLR